MKFLLRRLNFYQLPLIVLLIVIVITYFKVPQLFFSQDEWLGFGLMIGYGAEFVFPKNLMGIAHFVPLTLLIDYSIFKAFGLNYSVYNILALTFHFLNGFLIFLIFKELISTTKELSLKYKKFLPIIAAILFITSSVGYQLVMWTVININTLSLTFSLLAIFLLFKYRDKNMPLFDKLALSVFVLAALLIVEYAIALVLYLPLSFLISRRLKESIRKALKALWPVLILLAAYFAFRIPAILASSNVNVKAQEIGSMTIELSKLIKFPFRYLGQLVLPEKLMFLLSQILAKQQVFEEGFIFKLIAFSLGTTVILATILFIIWSHRKFVLESKNLLLILLFIICSALTFVFIPGQSSNFIIFPPRYLYFGIAGYALLLTYMLTLAILHKSQILVKTLFLLIILTIGFGILDNWVKSNSLYNEGKVRLQVLNTIKESHPNLPKKTVFYTHSDTSYYGLPPDEKILPFQSGFGQTLLVWYDQEMHFPKGLFKDKFLWQITEQGYKEVEEYGFGYYRDFDSLAKLVVERKIDLNSIISYSFNSKTNSLIDISTEVRNAILGYQVEKRPIDKQLYLVTSSTNSKDTSFLKDQDRTTFWDSKLISINPQYLIVDFGVNRKVSQVTIDSFDNKNQDKVGYKILLSINGVNYQEVFSLKLYPPDKKGIVNIYFKPQEARYIKIYQEGQHQYTSWVINELTIFESL